MNLDRYMVAKIIINTICPWVCLYLCIVFLSPFEEAEMPLFILEIAYIK